MTDARLDLSIHHICGVDELSTAPLATADRIVSIIAPDAAVPRELFALRKPILVLRFHDAIGREHGASLPNVGHIHQLLAFDEGADECDRLVIHCTAGISRSTAAFAILLAARHPGREDEIFSMLREIRPQAWPNSRMVTIGDRLLSRNGALIAALRRHYEVQVERYPEIGRMMVSIDRESEVPKARR